MLNWWHIGNAYKENPAIGWMLITFMIFLITLRQLTKIPLQHLLQVRHEKIKNLILENEKLRDEACLKLKICKERLFKIEGEINEIKNYFKEQGEHKFRQLKENIKRISDKSLNELNFYFQQEAHNYEKILKQEISTKILEKAKIILSHNKKFDSNLCKQLTRNIIND